MKNWSKFYLAVIVDLDAFIYYNQYSKEEEMRRNNIPEYLLADGIGLMWLRERAMCDQMIVCSLDPYIQMTL